MNRIPIYARRAREIGAELTQTETLGGDRTIGTSAISLLITEAPLHEDNMHEAMCVRICKWRMAQGRDYADP